MKDLGSIDLKGFGHFDSQNPATFTIREFNSEVQHLGG
jgi:hypothetical protein